MARFVAIACMVLCYFSGILAENRNTIGGKFTSSNSYYVGDAGLGVFDHSRGRWVKTKLPADVSASFGTPTTTNTKGEHRFVYVAGSLRVGVHDLVNSNAFLGIQTNGSETSGAIFDCFRPWNWAVRPARESPCATSPSIQSMRVSGSSVFACGTFNRIGSVVFNATNNQQSITRGIAEFKLDDSIDNNARGSWKFIWPRSFDATGNPSGGGPTNIASWSCSTMLGVGTQGNLIVQWVDATNAQTVMSKYNSGSGQWTEFARNYAISLNTFPLVNKVRSIREEVWVYGTNFVGTNEPANLPYLAKKGITSGSATGWSVTMQPNSTYTSQITDYVVSKSGTIYGKYPSILNAPFDAYHRRFRGNYVWQYTGGANGTAETAWTGTPLGGYVDNKTPSNGAIRFTRSAQGPTGTDRSSITEDFNLFYDENKDKVVVYGSNVNYLLFGNVEENIRSITIDTGVNTRPFTSDDTRLLREDTYRSIQIPNVVQFNRNLYEPLYAGGLQTVPTSIQSEASSGNFVYFFGSFKYVYQTWLHRLYSAQYHGKNFTLSRPFNLATAPSDWGLDTFPAQGVSPTVNVAKWLNKRDFLIAGQFRSITSEVVNSIAILTTEGTNLPKVTLVPSSAKSCKISYATIPSSSCYQVGVRTTSGTRNWEATYRTPGTINDVVVKGDDIYFSGRFDLFGSNPVHNVAKYNKKTGKIDPLFGGVQFSKIYDMLWFDGKLWVCGLFDQISDTITSNIAYWSNGKWSVPVNGITHGSVNRLYEHDGKLHAFGSFQKVSGLYSPYIAKWNDGKERFENVDLAITNVTCENSHYWDDRKCELPREVRDVINVGGVLFMSMNDGSIWDYDNHKGFQRSFTYNRFPVVPVNGKVVLGALDTPKDGIHLSLYGSSNLSPDFVETQNQVVFRPGETGNKFGKRNFVPSRQLKMEGGVNGDVHYVTDSTDKQLGDPLTGAEIFGIVFGSLIGVIVIVVIVVVVATGGGGGGGGTEYVSWSR